MKIPIDIKRDRDQLLCKAIELTTSPIVICDGNPALDCPIIFVNKAYSDLSGYSHEEILGLNPRFMHGKNREQPELSHLRNAIKEQRSIDTVIKNCKKDGSTYWCELSITPIHDSNSKLLHWVGIQKDVTDRILLESRQKEFIALFAHDMKNPIVGSNMVLSFLIQNHPEISDKLTVVKEANDGMLRLLWNIMDMYKVECGDLTFTNRAELGTMLSDCIAQLQYQADSKNIQIELAASDALILCEPESIKRVFNNLIHNAIKHTLPGTHVRVNIVTSSDHVEVSVRDNGDGIEPSQIEKLFKKFAEISSFKKKDNSNVGLGLYLSKLIVESHGGTISCHNEPDKGCTFTVKLPLSGPP